MSKKQWYVDADAKGLKIYKNCNTKADAEQLCKNLQKLYNPQITFWVDFNWRTSLEKTTESVIHGMFKKTKNIIKDCGEYFNNCITSWN